jgi:hypothetical protein
MKHFKKITKYLQIIQILLAFVLMFMLLKGVKTIFPLLKLGG